MALLRRVLAPFALQARIALVELAHVRFVMQALSMPVLGLLPTRHVYNVAQENITVGKEAQVVQIAQLERTMLPQVAHQRQHVPFAQLVP